MAADEILHIQRTTAIPATAPGPKKRFYITKDAQNGLNLGLDDTSGTRPARAIRDVIVNGPTTLYQSTAGVAIQGTYIISNYDSFMTYTVSVSAGSVSITGDTITVTSPTAAGPIYLKVNGEYSKILVKPPAVKTPSITYPVAGLALATSFTATADAFVTSGPADTCASTTWQVATDRAFTQLVINATTAGAVPSKALSGLVYNTTYYIRMRYTGTALGASEWSLIVKAEIQLKGIVAGEVKIFPPPAAVASERSGSRLALNYANDRLVVGSVSGGGTGLAGRFTLYTLSAGVWTKKQVFSVAGSVASDGIGAVLAMSHVGTWVAVGIPGKSDQAANAGAVALFQWVDGVYVQTSLLRQDVVSAGSLFGSAVAFDTNGNRLLVGAPGKGTNQGAVYVFKNTTGTWTQEAVLSSSGAGTGDLIGRSVALTDAGDVAVIGAPGGSFATTNGGEVHIYRRVDTIWTLEQSLHLGTGVAGGLYGTTVQISCDGEEIFVYAKNELSGAVVCGTVYVYRRYVTEWRLFATLVPSDKVAGQLFGNSLSLGMKGGRIVIGAPGDANQGAVYVFEKVSDVWTQKVKVVPTVRATGELFGDSVVVSSDESCLYVGAPGSSKTASYAGQAYQFK